MNNASRSKTIIENSTIVRILFIVSIFIGSAFLLYKAYVPIIWTIIAFFLALALEPFIEFTMKILGGPTSTKRRGLAIFVCFVIISILLSGLLLILIPPFVDQLNNMIRTIPSWYEQFLASDNPITSYLRQHKITDSITANQLAALSNYALSLGRGLFMTGFAIVMIAIFTFYMSLEGPRWFEVLLRYQPPDKRALRREMLIKMHKTVTGYVGGNLFTSLIASITAGITLALLHVPYALTLAVTVGVVNLIPMIGTNLAIFIVCTITLLSSGPTKALIMLIFFICYQAFENSYLSNQVYARAVQISPLVVGISSLLGGFMAGFLGALIAIPVAASMQILVKFYLDRRYQEMNRA